MSFASLFRNRDEVRWLLLIAAALACPAAAQGLSESLPLRNGAFAWAEGVDAMTPASAGGADALSITISIAEQRLYIYRSGRLIGVSTASTGKRGHSTPLGDFTILQKHQWHRSNLYSNAPMPYMQRLTWTGIALHAGHLPGYPASHGCIRLPLAFAKRLFAITTLGVPVTIVGPYRNQPVVKLRFADIAWLVGDEVVTVRPATEGAPPARIMPAALPPAFVPPVAVPAPIVDERFLPPTPRPDGPHWASPDAIAAVRRGKPPKLDFEILPE